MSYLENKFYHPTGSPLADEVSKAIDEAHKKQAIEQEYTLLHKCTVSEDKRKKEVQFQREIEETEKALRLTYNRFGISQILQDLRKNVWRGGQLSESVLVKQPKVGTVSGRLEFSYPNATEGRHEISEGEQGAAYRTAWHPTIYTQTDSLEIGVLLERGTQFLFLGDPFPSSYSSRSSDIWCPNNRIPIETAEDNNIKKELMALVVEDSKRRIIHGLLPLSEAASKGNETVKEVAAFAKRNHLKIMDKR